MPDLLKFSMVSSNDPTLGFVMLGPTFFSHPKAGCLERTVVSIFLTHELPNASETARRGVATFLKN